MHIQCGKYVGITHDELSHCLVTEDQWDYFQSVPEEHGDKQLFLKYQSSTDILLKLLYFEPCLNSLCFFSSLSHCCCHDVPCAQNFSVEEIRVFQTCLVENPSVKVVYFENHAEWRFCLAPFVCRALLARWRLVGVVALGWRSGARACCPFLVCFSLCVPARFRWTFILTHATALKPSHSKSYPLHHIQQGYEPNLCLC